jgi:hypothetical protein
MNQGKYYEVSEPPSRKGKIWTGFIMKIERSDDYERLDENDWVFYKNYTASSYKKICKVLKKECKRLNEEKMK